ncbi:hypothetical protein B0H67DRAFT_493169 [Lasiosphaeris hirsuta]|uniref:Uncharacterized protein n=1 Tax=Lasiosphaeris hirsuta TaxID=260670 RepID=A0AA40DTF1_9PEZI|nr:hypothetical protein B0H67DRAFT_493169 [Lasiosphaeris hirsuta]
MATGNASSATASACRAAPLGTVMTSSEVLAYNMELARANGVNKPQDFKPADNDPNRLYWVREPNGVYLQRDRRTIDHLNCRWYVKSDGVFYAVRLN